MMSDIAAESVPAIGQAYKSSPIASSIFGALKIHGAYSSAQAALSCAVGRGCHVGMPATGKAHSSDLRLFLHQATQEPQDWSAAMTLSGVFGSLQIQQGERLLHALSGIHVSVEATQSAQHWQWLQGALCGRLAHTPFSDVSSLDWNSGSFENASVLRLTLHSAEHRISVHARASAKHWLNWLNGVRWHRSKLPWTQSLTLPLEMPLLLARHTLPAGVAAALKPGDIVIPEQAFFDCHGRASMTVGKQRMEVQMQRPGQLKIIAIDTHLDTPAMENTDIDAFVAPVNASEDDAINTSESVALEQSVQSVQSVQSDVLPENSVVSAGLSDSLESERQASVLDTVPLTLSFELGRSQTTLGQLRELQAGSVMTLNGASSSSIAIVSGAYRVGTGEVVNVDGQLGIRIVHWGVTA